ncbi:MAG: hypothetical protein KC680_02840 [Candidatus Peregrinibacteria bacterium]|nr:hypothetical protein [Candidatus Peregrinibacteria bacterium]MCB9807971.1 hypothetical protein [Candidatus Peribacteria bacterium]
MKEQTIEAGGIVYAKIFRADEDLEDAVHFFTEDADPLQVGIFERAEGYDVVPHKHNPRELSLEYPGEFLWIQSGEVQVTIFDDDWTTIDTLIVNGGECLVIMKGGHEMKMLKPTRLLEVKQGPYIGRENDKTFRDTV